MILVDHHGCVFDKPGHDGIIALELLANPVLELAEECPHLVLELPDRPFSTSVGLRLANGAVLGNGSEILPLAPCLIDGFCHHRLQCAFLVAHERKLVDAAEPEEIAQPAGGVHVRPFGGTRNREQRSRRIQPSNKCC